MKGDPLDELQAAWRNLDPPSPHADEDPPADAVTRATVAWMREAWDALEAPAPELAATRSATERDVSRRTLRLLPLAGAVAAGWLLFLLWIAGSSEEAANEIAVAPEQNLPAMRATLRDDGAVELRSGVVRIVLVDRPTTPDPNREPRTTGEDR